MKAIWLMVVVFYCQYKIKIWSTIVVVDETHETLIFFSFKVIQPEIKIKVKKLLKVGSFDRNILLFNKHPFVIFVSGSLLLVPSKVQLFLYPSSKLRFMAWMEVRNGIIALWQSCYLTWLRTIDVLLRWTNLKIAWDIGNNYS